MIQLNYSLTKKDYKKFYTEVTTIYLMKIYFFVLLLGMVFFFVIGNLFKIENFLNAGFSLLRTFIPTLILCLFLSIFVCYLEIKKIEKTHPEIMEGNFKIRFEKSFMILQISGANNKMTYASYRLFKGFNHCVMLQHNTEKKHIIVPKGLLSPEQIKTIKANIRG